MMWPFKSKPKEEPKGIYHPDHYPAPKLSGVKNEFLPEGWEIREYSLYCWHLWIIDKSGIYEICESFWHGFEASGWSTELTVHSKVWVERQVNLARALSNPGSPEHLELLILKAELPNAND